MGSGIRWFDGISPVEHLALNDGCHRTAALRALAEQRPHGFAELLYPCRREVPRADARFPNHEFRYCKVLHGRFLVFRGFAQPGKQCLARNGAEFARPREQRCQGRIGMLSRNDVVTTHDRQSLPARLPILSSSCSTPIAT